MSKKFVFVLMDNHQAFIWKEGLEADSAKLIVKAHDPFPEHDARAGEPRGPEAIAPFLEEVSTHLKGAGAILLMGPGKGKASGVLHLRDYLMKKHPDIAEKIYEIESADIARSSERETLARARTEWHRYLQSH